MPELKLVNVGVIINGTPSGVSANDIRLPNGKVAENVRIFAFEDELPPEMFCRLDLDYKVIALKLNNSQCGNFFQGLDD